MHRLSFFRGKYPPHFPPLTRNETEEDFIFWKQALENAPLAEFDGKPDPDPLKDWVQVQSKRKQAEEKIAGRIFATLSRENLKIEKKILSRPTESEDLKFEKKGCPFCTEKILSSEKIAETPYSYALYNFKPVTPKGHFLIFPKRHLSFSERLSKEEIEDMHALAVRVTKLFEEKADIILYTQDGHSVGQSVAHTHMHLLLAPSPLRFFFCQLNYNQEKPVTREEMQSVVQDFSERLSKKDGSRSEL